MTEESKVSEVRMQKMWKENIFSLLDRLERIELNA